MIELTNSNYNIAACLSRLSMQTFLCMIFLMSGGTDFGSGALSGKMLLVRIVENKIDDYFRVG